jgi:hypothetical protein
MDPDDAPGPAVSEPVCVDLIPDLPFLRATGHLALWTVWLLRPESAQHRAANSEGDPADLNVPAGNGGDVPHPGRSSASTACWSQLFCLQRVYDARSVRVRIVEVFFFEQSDPVVCPVIPPRPAWHAEALCKGMPARCSSSATPKRSRCLSWSEATGSGTACHRSNGSVVDEAALAPAS